MESKKSEKIVTKNTDVVGRGIKKNTMKKIITSIAMLAVFSGSALAQQHSLNIRAYGGINILQLSTDNSTSIINGIVHNTTISGRTGYQAGGSITFGSRGYIQPGFQYTNLSTKIVNKSTIDQANVFTDETTVQVISIPLKFGFRFIDPQTEDFFNVRVFGGFDGHHVIGVKHGTNSGAIGEITKDDYTNLILNADFGMGVDLWFLFIDAGYQIGLTPVHSSGDKAKASAFYTNLGIRIKL